VFGILSGNHSAKPLQNRKEIPSHPQPKKKKESGKYPARLAGKSDFSCWTYGLATQQISPADSAILSSLDSGTSMP